MLLLLLLLRSDDIEGAVRAGRSRLQDEASMDLGFVQLTGHGGW